MTWSLCAVVLAIAIGIQLDGGDEAAIRWGWQPAIDLWRGNSWALVTSSLVHVALLHLAFNLYWLWVLGRSVERVLGPLRLAGLVLASALVSSAGQLAWSDETGIGFSGVGYALFGFAWVLSLHRRDLGIEVSRQTVRLFGIWLLFGIFATYARLVNFGNAAHLIGGIFGICAGLTFIDRWRRAALTGIGALLMLAALVSVWAPWSPTWNAARSRPITAAITARRPTGSTAAFAGEPTLPGSRRPRRWSVGRPAKGTRLDRTLTLSAGSTPSVRNDSRDRSTARRNDL